MSAQAQGRSRATDAETGDLVAVAKDPAAYDKMIAELVRTRESSHDRERRAQAAEKQLEKTQAALRMAEEALDRDAKKMREELDAQAAELAAREVEIEEREAKIARFNQMIDVA